MFTNYKTKGDLENECVPTLRAIGAICFNYAYTVDAVGQSDRDVEAYHLIDTLLRDVAKGIEEYANQDEAKAKK